MRRQPAATRGTIGQRVRATLLAAIAWLACRLPEGPLIRAADLVGESWYRLSPARAARARRNLGRVLAYLAEREGGSPDAVDRRRLERLVRAAFRHHARYYLEVARAPAMDARMIRERLLIETPDAVDEAFRGGGPVVFVGLHFGAIELPAFYFAQRTGRPATAPMETLGDPEIQRWIVRSRGSVGVRIVGLAEARHELLAALRRGETVGLVGDRDITGSGMAVPFFGAPAPLPIGPALLAIESRAPTYVVAVRREGIGRYRGRARRIEVPQEGGRRERLRATLEAIVRAFEDEIAIAPEQWWAVFFPIWPDLEAAAASPDERAPAAETAA